MTRKRESINKNEKNQISYFGKWKFLRKIDSQHTWRTMEKANDAVVYVKCYNNNNNNNISQLSDAWGDVIHLMCFRDNNFPLPKWTHQSNSEQTGKCFLFPRYRPWSPMGSVSCCYIFLLIRCVSNLFCVYCVQFWNMPEQFSQLFIPVHTIKVFYPTVCCLCWHGIQYIQQVGLTVRSHTMNIVRYRFIHAENRVCQYQ